MQSLAQGALGAAIIPTQLTRDVAFRKDDAIPQLQQAEVDAKKLQEQGAAAANPNS